MLLSILLTSFQAFAHPVTFKDGVAVTSIHRPKMTMTQANYTIHGCPNLVTHICQEFAFGLSSVKSRFVGLKNLLTVGICDQ